MHVIELHAANLLQLLFHPPAHFKGVFQALADSFFCVRAIGANKFQKSRHRSTHSNRVALVEVVAQLEVFIDSVCKTAFAHLADPLSQVVNNQTVLIGEKLRAHFGDFPARYVGMETVEKRRIDHHVRKRGEQMTCLNQRFNTLSLR